MSNVVALAAHADEPEKKKRIVYPCDEDLRSQILELLESGQITRADLRSDVGYSEGVWSTYLSEHGNLYEGAVSKVEKKLREWLRDRRNLLDTQVKTIECDVSKQLHQYLEDIRTGKSLGLIIGEAGWGKTRGKELYAKDHELAIVVDCWIGLRSPNDLMEAMFRLAAVARPKRGENRIQTLCREMRGSNRMFIFDDAHKLSRMSLQLITDFWDQTGNPCALIGLPKLKEKMADDSQRLRRVGYCEHLKAPELEPVIHHLINQIIPDVGDERADLVSLCKEVAKNEGVFGSVEKQLTRAKRIKAGAPDKSWTWCFRAAHKRLVRNYTLMGGAR